MTTSITAFVGFTATGPTDKVLDIGSFADFERQCGGLHHDSPVSYAVRQFFLNGGTQARVVRVAGADGRHGVANDIIRALGELDAFNLLVIPETFDMKDGEEVRVVQAAAGHCEEHRAFYIVDAPATRTSDDIAKWAGAVSRSPNAAVYFPAVRIADPLDDSRPRTVAPSGTMAGVFAHTDARRGVWKAPAGTEATLKGVLELAEAVTDRDSSRLNPLGINLLRSFPGRGCVAWGSRTMQGDDGSASEYKYIPVRRTALFIEQSLRDDLRWVVFEPNDEPLWARIRMTASDLMQNLFRQGAFHGSTPREAWFVRCDTSTTTQADQALGIVSLIVGFAPLKPAEFVMITIRLASVPRP
jgi:phage tail sheath protein FI